MPEFATVIFAARPNDWILDELAANLRGVQECRPP
jgi:hypothetical protein